MPNTALQRTGGRLHFACGAGSGASDHPSLSLGPLGHIEPAMKFRLVHTNYLGQIHSEHGNSCRKNTTAKMEFLYESLDAARQHAQTYVRRFPELECDIRSEDGTVQERIHDEQAQAEFIRQFCTVPKRGRIRDAILASVFVGSLIANFVMLFLLLRRS